MIAIENDTLDEYKRKLFIELVEKHQQNEFFQQAFEEFEKRKTCCCYKTGEICPETGYSFTECKSCGDGILEEETNTR